MSNPPTGTVTFLFSDIEGSTMLAQGYPTQWESLRARHHAILRAAIESHNGTIFQDSGDGFCAAFHTAPEAARAALEAQQALCREEWQPAPVKVRMGIHTGAAELNLDGLQPGYTGYTTLALTNRIMSAGHGGQILLSSTTRELVREALPDNTEILDLGERRLRDLLHPERLSQLYSAGLQKTFPPLKTLEAFPNNLPTQLTTFIGREKEIIEIKSELDTHRLVTLTGSGGTGKTRLSLQVAAELLDCFDHGAWFVELAPLADPEWIPQAVLSAIGLSEQAGMPPLEQLKDYLQNKQILIVLDNCEHLIEASSRTANELLNAAPQLKILASSREALGVKGELAYPVPSLSSPNPRKMPPFEQLSQYEAVQLFIDRALLVSPHMIMDQINAPHIAQICYRLDGIPLAIELAAARIKMMSVEQISNRLNDRFRLLTGGARTALPRQQTLRALIDWSYDLLTETERILLQRLSVFVGGWTLGTAEDVCSGEGIDPLDILDLLGQLVNKSLVSVIECSDCRVIRYRMLETIRQYAREKLLESDGSEVIHQKHLAYFVRLALEAGPELTRARQVEWLKRLEEELDNLRAALEWSLHSGPAEGLHILTGSHRFWETRINVVEFCDWLKDFLDRYPAEDSLRARALGVYAWCLGYRDDLVQARAVAERALQISRAISDRSVEAYSLLTLGAGIGLQGDLEEAISYVEEGLAIYRALGDIEGQSAVFSWLSLNHNDLEQSKALLRESLRLNREIGNLFGIAEALRELAHRTIWGGDFSAPIAWLEEARGIFRALGDEAGEGGALHVYGVSAYYQRDYARAREYFQEAIRLVEKTGSSIHTSWARVFLACTLFQSTKFPEAKELFEVCIQQAQKAKNITGITFALENLASMHLQEGHFSKAAQLYAWANATRDRLKNQRPPVERAYVEKDLAELHSHLDDEAFAEFSQTGRALSADQAVDLALEG